MCGISVQVNKNGKVNGESLRHMNEKIAHRGPDDEGYFIGENFGFGHRRLSIIDLSKNGHQPMQHKHLWIVYNGEIYNYVELREELTVMGCEFHSTSDTEVILAAYARWGRDCFSRFNGMWAFAIYDGEQNEIVLSRDHFGIKPLYFCKTEHVFLAGSEVKQFLGFSELPTSLNKGVALNFLVKGLLNYSDETFFEGINELRPGHCLVYNLTRHEHEVIKWYCLDASAIPIRDNYTTAVQKVRNLLVDSVKLRMRSDVRVGSCLSGGIDSSSIVTIVHSQEIANADFETITSCHADKNYDEQRFSDVVSVKTGFKASKIYPDMDALLENGDLDKMIYHQDQPFSGGTHYSEFKVFEMARKNKLIVMQDGQGSDEYLSGYREFYVARVIELVKALRFNEALKTIVAKARHKNTTTRQELREVLRTVVGFRVIRLMKRILGRNDYPWLSDSWRKMARQELLNFDSYDVRRLSMAQIQHSSIPYQLHSEDRNSMTFSIESRLPFLDHRLVEYVIGLPSSYKIKDGYSKAVLRDAIQELPEAIKYRKDKMGFVAPDGPWIMKNKDIVRKDLVELSQSSEIFSQDLVKRFDKYIKGELEYEPIYFRAMAFQRFCKIFNLGL
jgi:asparagine synthase (glutamine-hydrolysing)